MTDPQGMTDFEAIRKALEKAAAEPIDTTTPQPKTAPRPRGLRRKIDQAVWERKAK